MKKWFVTLVICSCILPACKKTRLEETALSANGKLTAGVGCSAWLIQLSDNSLLQPTNLDSFQVTKVSGQAVTFSYEESNNQASSCQSADVINLFSIKDE